MLPRVRLSERSGGLCLITKAFVLLRFAFVRVQRSLLSYSASHKLDLSFFHLIYAADENILADPPFGTEPCYTLHFARADKVSIFHRNTLKGSGSSL